jgi:hypothetical protein
MASVSVIGSVSLEVADSGMKVYFWYKFMRFS